MADEIYWYVLFVRTGAEERLATRLKNELGDGYFLFMPHRTCVFRRQGKKSLFQKICFPGYIFIETGRSAQEFRKHAFPIIYKQKEAYRFLSYGNQLEIAMRDEERVALSSVIDSERKIDISIGFKEGDMVRVISGPLEGNESKIVKINKSRNEAVLVLRMFNSTFPVTVGLEVLIRNNFVVDS